MLVKISAAVLLAASSAQGQLIENNYVTGCVGDGEYDPTIDYFPEKYEPPSIYDYDETTDIYGEEFVPHNTTDLLEIRYFPNYKIVLNKHQNVSYLLFQCGTAPPQEEVDSKRHHLVLPVPHQGGVAVTQTPQIPPLELLGRRQDIIAYIGDPTLVSSPCMRHLMEEGDIETIYNAQDAYNSTNNAALRADFLERHPDAIVFGGPTLTDELGDRTMNVAASQERTNVATFDWIAMYAALFNLEAFSNQISQETQARYDCTSTNAAKIVDARDRRQLQEEEHAAVLIEEDQRQLQKGAVHHNKSASEIKILWAIYFTGYNWSVAQCDTWDSAYYCEYATHCGTNIISRPPELGSSQNFGGPITYWYLNDDELLSIGKDADIFIFPSNGWDDVYATHNATLDQIKAVQNKQVYDNQGSGSNAWFEQRLAEYDVVGLDLCDLVGTANPNNDHVRRWFRNIFTEPVGDLPACNVPEELAQPYVPQGAECELLTEEDFATTEMTEGGATEGDAMEESGTQEETTEEEGTEETPTGGGSDTTTNEGGNVSVDKTPDGAVKSGGAVVPSVLSLAVALFSMFVVV